jgi:hypothetical protein
LASAGKSTIWRILEGGEIKPRRVRYYLERCDADFARKMAEVLVVYREVSLHPPDAPHDARAQLIHTVSVDEKPGVQALGTTAADLPLTPGRYTGIGRDYEYLRYEPVQSLLSKMLKKGKWMNCKRA